MLTEDNDDTVRVAPVGHSPPRAKPVVVAVAHPPRRAAIPWIPLAALAGVIALGLTVWLAWPRHPAPGTAGAPPSLANIPPPSGTAAVTLPPATSSRSTTAGTATTSSSVAPTSVVPQGEFAIETADEQLIREHVATGMMVFRFAPNPRIIVLDFASLRQQGLMLNRIAAFIEKAHMPHDRVLTDAELDKAIRDGGDTVETYYYGHDYSAAELARFFTVADRQGVRLNDEEERLRRLLRQLDWLASGAQGGLISIPRVGADEKVTPSARATILHHELSHGEYFSNPTYAAYVHRFWADVLTAGERDGVKRFLGEEEYDTALEEVMENEMQAYLMFTRDPAFFTPDRASMTPARLAELQATFLRNMPAGWLHDELARIAPISAR